MASFSHEEQQMIPRNQVLAPLSTFLLPSLSQQHHDADQTFQLDHEITDSLELIAVRPSNPREWPKDSVFLTWQDLWVTVSKKGSRQPILEGLNGYAQPGEVLAIMGPSGCGKSTLLDALAGRLDSGTAESGRILVNGGKQALAFGTSAYVTQDDILTTALTVGEVVYYSALLQLPDSMSKSDKLKRANTTIKEMGLQDVINTRIGGWSNKGISGGQKKRVSICLEILTRPKLLFLDEPTSGLDSAASYHVMKKIAGLARQDGRTVIASIHQPSALVFHLFHNLCLLSSGKTIYFGPISNANQFFSLNGFPCPTMMNPSDHYLTITNTDFDQDVEQGFGKSTAAEAIKVLTTSYKSSTICQRNDDHIAELLKLEGGILEKGSQASFITQAWVLSRRSFLNMHRDIGYYWARFVVYIALTLCLGTIFYDIGHSYSSIRGRGAMLLFVSLLLCFLSIGGFPSFVEDMKVFYRERLNGHYGVAAFVCANTISSVPYLILVSVVPGTIVYFLVGLQKGPDHFAYFILMIITSTMLVESLMMIVASIVPNFLVGIIAGAGIQGIMVLNAGFFQLPNDLPNPLWKYPMYYIAFHRYANEGLYKNEYEGLTFPNETGEGPRLTFDDILKGMWQMQLGYSKWVDLLILVGMVVLYRTLFFFIIKTTEKMKPILRSLRSNHTKQTNSIMVEPSSTLPHVGGVH